MIDIVAFIVIVTILIVTSVLFTLMICENDHIIATLIMSIFIVIGMSMVYFLVSPQPTYVPPQACFTQNNQTICGNLLDEFSCGATIKTVDNNTWKCVTTYYKPEITP